MTNRLVPLVMCAFLPLVALGAEDSPWRNDFAFQPLEQRPALEVRYTDSMRTAFEVVAEAYHVVGQLKAPHLLREAESGRAWIELAIELAGQRYTTAEAAAPSRINLYRRGPYYCEVRWLDLTFADAAGKAPPLKGDLALFCYPSKILASLTLHATEESAALELSVAGIAERTFHSQPFAPQKPQAFSWPLFGEDAPLPAEALVTNSAERPLSYDPVRGCYRIGSSTPGAFQQHFYHHPNLYESVSLSVQNDSRPRRIYVMHETVGGALGVVEGGVLLDAEGHPLPIVVQISKNFAGEKEEKFYNPEDTPFSETFFPLVLAPDERCTLTSLHLYQNWGRKMVKQFSSLGAWMDYFHSSTGVTETTCYVPFFFGGHKGIAIADFRAMSQTAFWGGQPQHDNIAGHSFLWYRDGDGWKYPEYRGAAYRSTGPNWMDVGFEYLSTDGKVRMTIDTFELPQKDELRNFIRVRYEALQPIAIDNAKEDLRLLTMASWTQHLRYTHFAASGHAAQPLSFEQDHFPVRGAKLPPANSYMAIYGDPKGSNAFVLRSWKAPFGPAASVLCEKNGQTRLMLAADVDRVQLAAGDRIEFEGFFLAYGDSTSAAPAEREARVYGSAGPRVVEVRHGRKLSDFPCRIVAEGDRAEVVLQGGRDLVPVIVSGLSDYRRPLAFHHDYGRWQPLGQSRVGELDGVQVFAEPGGAFGAVALVPAGDAPQRLMIGVGAKQPALPRIVVAPGENPRSLKLTAAPLQRSPLVLEYPRRLAAGDTTILAEGQWSPNEGGPHAAWRESAGGSRWFERRAGSVIVGGRLSPNEDDVDLELWVGNEGPQPLPLEATLAVTLANTRFRAGAAAIAVLRDGRWVAHRAGESQQVNAISVADANGTLAIGWDVPMQFEIDAATDSLIVRPVLPPCPSKKRIHVRGKLYCVDAPAAGVQLRIARELIVGD
jgi:hypothetical protein